MTLPPVSYWLSCWMRSIYSMLKSPQESQCVRPSQSLFQVWTMICCSTSKVHTCIVSMEPSQTFPRAKKALERIGMHLVYFTYFVYFVYQTTFFVYRNIIRASRPAFGFDTIDTISQSIIALQPHCREICQSSFPDVMLRLTSWWPALSECRSNIVHIVHIQHIWHMLCIAFRLKKDSVSTKQVSLFGTCVHSFIGMVSPIP